jgi:hypothetical protein
MPISSKRSGSQQTISRYQQQQSVPQDNGYDDYVYYPYYSKATPNGDYEYRQESRQYEQQPRQYYETHATNNSAPVRRT